VLLGNFAVLQTVDPGYFGQGIYLTMDPEYAIEEYGRRVFGLTRVPLLICVVVVGNTLPVMPLRTPPGAMAAGISDVFFFCAGRRLLAQVIESPNSADGFHGKAIVGKADSHVVRVAKDPDANCGAGDYKLDPLPCLPARWAAVQSFSEIVVRDESLVLPLGYVVVDFSG
jgi:hypothetical protein